MFNKFSLLVKKILTITSLVLITISPLSSIYTYSAGTTISGHLFSDVNSNGIQDGTDVNLSGVTGNIKDLLNTNHAFTTDSNGNYSSTVAVGAATITVNTASGVLAGSTVTTTLAGGTNPQIVVAVFNSTVNANAIGFHLAPTPLTTADLTGLNYSCASAPTNSSTTCNFNLPTDKTLPSFSMAIGDSASGGTCTTVLSAVTCLNVPTGSQAGSKTIYGKISTGTSVAGNGTATITRSLNTSDLSNLGVTASVSCASSIIGLLASCSGTLPDYLTTPSGTLKLKVNGQLPSTCIFIGQGFSCTGLNLGTTTGSVPILGAIGASTYVNIGSNINIDPREIVSADISLFNVSCSPALANSLTNCNLILPTGSVLPTLGLNLGIGNATDNTFSLCSLVSATAVHCDNVPTGSTNGSQLIYAKIGTAAKISTTNLVDITVPQAIIQTDLSSLGLTAGITCSPSTVNVESTTSCSGTLPAGLLAPLGTLKLGLPGQNFANCTFSGQTFTCNNLPVGTSIGTQGLQARIDTGLATTIGTNLTVNPINLLATDLQNLTFNCNPALVNSTTTCTFVLPSSRIFPSDFSLQIGNGVTSNSCTVVVLTVTCINVPTGTALGDQIIYGKVGNSALIDTGEKAIVSSTSLVLNINDIYLNKQCPQTTIGNTFNCSFDLTSNSDFVLPTGGLTTAYVDLSAGRGTCTIASLKLVCSNIPTTALSAGDKNVFISLAGVVGIDAGDVTLVYPPLISADLAAIQYTCQSANIITTTSCNFNLPTNKTLPGDFHMGINNGTITTSSCILNNTLVTCSNVNSGNQSGNQNIFAQIGSESKVDTGETVLITQLLTTADLSNLSVLSTLSCLPNPVDSGATVTCSGSLPSNYLTPNGVLKLNVQGQNSANCVFSGQNFICSNLPAGNSTGLKNIQAAIDNSAKQNTGVQVTVASLALTTAEINALTITCADADTNSFTTCSFSLPVNRHLPANFKLGIGDSATGGSCSTDNINIICTNVPTGSQDNTQNIYAQIASESRTNSGETAQVYTSVALANIFPNPNCSTTLVGSTLNCTFTLTGGSVYRFSSSSPQTIARISSSGFSGICGITLGSLVCQNIPTTDSTRGLQDLEIILPNSASAIKGQVILTNYLQESDLNYLGALASMECAPNPVDTNSVITCSGDLPEYILAPLGSLKLNIEGQSQVTCAFTNQSFNCENIPTGLVAGSNLNIQASIDSSNPVNIRETVIVNLVPLSYSDLSTLNITCQSALVNTTTTCTFPLTPGKSLPNNLKLAIGNISPSGSCSLSGSTASCTNVPTGSQNGTQTIFTQLGNNSIQTNANSATLNISTRPLDSTDLTNLGSNSLLDCTPNPVFVESIVDCSGTLANNITAPTGTLKLKLSGQNFVDCTFTGQNFTCSNLPTGTITGIITVQAALDSSTPIDTDKTVTVNPKPLATSEIAALTYTCNTALTLSTTTCAFTLPNNRTLPDNFKMAIGNGTSSGTCTVNGSNVTCNQVPVGSQPNSQNIYAQIGTEAKTDTGETTNITQAPTEINLANIVYNNNCGTVNLGNTFNCTFQLTGTSGGGYILPTGTTIAKLTNQTATGNCTLSNNTLVCINLPSINGARGTNTITISLPDNNSAIKGNTTINSELNQNDLVNLTSLANLSCSPSSTDVNTTTDCNGILPANILAPSGSLKLKIGEQNYVDCVFSGQNFTCTNLPVGTNSGSYPIKASLDNTTYSSTTSSIQVNATIAQTPLDNNDLTNLDLACQSALVNSTTTCSFTLQNNKTLPNDLKLGIGNAQLGGNCSLAGSTVTCTNVPTGSQSGTQSIYAQIGNGNVVDTSKVTNLTINTRPLDTNDLATLDSLANINCTPNPVYVSLSTTCSGTLPNNITAPSQTLKLNLLGQSSVDCVFSGQSFTCSNLPVGTDVSTLSLQAALGNTNPTNTGKTIAVIASPLTTNEITTLNFTCTSAQVNTLTNCSFTLPNNRTLPDNFKMGIGDSAIGGVCSASGSTITCTDVPAGSQNGNQIIYAQINTDPKTDTGETVNITPAPTVIGLSNIVYNNACPETNLGNTFDCTFQLTGDNNGGGYILPNGTVNASITNQNNTLNNCTVVSNTLVCTGIPSSDGSRGNNFINITLPDSTTAIKGEVILDSELISTDLTNLFSLTNLSCNPNPVNVNTATTCNGTLPTSIIAPVNSILKLNIMGQNSVDCVFSGQSFTCSNLPVGSQITNAISVQAALDNNTPVNTGATISIQGVPIIEADLTSLNINCQSSLINYTTTCNFNLPTGKTLPNNLKLAVSDAALGGSCSLNNLTVTCTNVPTGSQSGNQTIYAQLGNGNIVDTTNITTLSTATRPLDNTDLPSLGTLSMLSCTLNPVGVESTTTCSGILPNNLTRPTDILKLNLIDQNSGNCIFSGQSFTCSSLPTGTVIGSIGLEVRIGNNTATTTDSTVAVTAIPLSNNDFTSLIYTCNSGQTNSTTTCTFTLPDNRTLPTDFKMGIGDSTPNGSCNVTGSTVTCTNVPTGSQSGTQSIYAQIGTQTKIDTTQTTSITLASSEIDLTNIVYNNNCGTINLGSTFDCTFQLTGGSNSNYVLPSGNTTINLTNQTATGNCVVNSNALVCNNIPSTNGIRGSNTLTITLGNNNSAIKGNLTLNSELNPNDLPNLASLTNLSCSRNPTDIDTTVSCNGSLPNNVLAPSGNLSLKIGTQSSVNCIFSGQNFTCSNLPIGSNSGSYPLKASLDSSTYSTTSLTIEVSTPQQLPLDDNELTNLNLSCQSALVNTTTTCSFTLPNNKILPDNLKLAVGNALKGGNCSQNVSTVTCSGVPTGTQNGIQPIYTQIGNGNVVDTTKTTTLTTFIRPLDNTDLANVANVTMLNCSPDPVGVESTTTCSGILPTNLTSPSQTLKLKLSGQNSVDCVFLEQSFSCSNLPTGTTPGTIIVQAALGNTTVVDTDKTVVVTSTPLNTNDISGLTFSCNGSQTNSITTCSFSLPNNRTLPNNFKMAVGNASPDGNCTVNGSVVTCTNVPVGSQSGSQTIYAQIGDSTKTDTGETINITPAPTLISQTNIVYNNACPVTTIGSNLNCTFQLTGNNNEGGYVLPDGVTNINITGQSDLASCTVSGNTLICNNISTTNGTRGNNTLTITLGNGSSAVKGEVVLQSTLNSNDLNNLSNLANLSCSPNPVPAGNSLTCSGNLSDNILPPNGTLKLNIQGQNAVSCIFSNQNFSCSNLLSGYITGQLPFQAAIDNTVPTNTGYTEIVTSNPQSSPLTDNDTQNLDITCEPATTNSTTTCSFTLPQNKTLPSNTSISLDDVTQGDLCTVNNQSVVTCSNIPTPTQSGDKNVKISVAGSPKQETGDIVNIQPTTQANNDSVSTNKNSSIIINVLANDSGSNLAITNTTNPSNGSIIINSDKTITYTPNSGFIGNDSFSYTIQNSFGTSTATVQITVNDTPPVSPNPPITTPTPSDNPTPPDNNLVLDQDPVPTTEPTQTDNTVENNPDPGNTNTDSSSQTNTTNTNTLPEGIDYKTLGPEVDGVKTLDADINFNDTVSLVDGRKIKFMLKNLKFDNETIAANQICQFVITTPSQKELIIQSITTDQGDCVIEVNDQNNLALLKTLFGNINVEASNLVSGSINTLFEQAGNGSFHVRIPNNNNVAYVTKELSFNIASTAKDTIAVTNYTDINNRILGLIIFMLLLILFLIAYTEFRIRKLAYTQRKEARNTKNNQKLVN